MHVQSFLQNVRSRKEILQMYAKSAVANQTDRDIAIYIDRVRKMFGIDLKIVATKPREIDRSQLSAITRIAPRKVIDGANARVTTKIKNEIAESIHNATIEGAKQLHSPSDPGNPNSRLEQ
jgi:hypothetical protein